MESPRRRRMSPIDAERDLLDVLMSIREPDGTPRFDAGRRDGHVHLDDVRRAPHHVRDRRLDTDRATQAPRGARAGDRRTGASWRPTARR